MFVHLNFVEKNLADLLYYIFLGDDGIMGFNREPDVKNLGVDIATNFNM